MDPSSIYTPFLVTVFKNSFDDNNNTSWYSAFLNLICTEIAWGILLKLRFCRSGVGLRVCVSEKPHIMLIYKFVDLTWSNREPIFFEHLICSNHCSKCFTCRNSFNLLNCMMMIIPKLPANQLRLSEVHNLSWLTQPARGRALVLVLVLN